MLSSGASGLVMGTFWGVAPAVDPTIATLYLSYKIYGLGNLHICTLYDCIAYHLSGR